MAAPMAAAVPGGWSCAADGRGRARARTGRSGPGATTRTYLQVAIGQTAAFGVPPTVSVSSGGQTVTARSGSGVVTSGPARAVRRRRPAGHDRRRQHAAAVLLVELRLAPAVEPGAGRGAGKRAVGGAVLVGHRVPVAPPA